MRKIYILAKLSSKSFQREKTNSIKTSFCGWSGDLRWLIADLKSDRNRHFLL